MLIRRGLWTAVVSAVLALAACGGADPGPAGAAEDAASPGPSASLDFTVATLDGATFEGASLVGRPSVLWFWAPWCPTCVAQAPDVTALADGYADRVSVVGVAGLDDNLESMQWFVDATGVEGFPHLADADGVVWQRFGITAQSSFVVLDADGAVVLKGSTSAADVRDQLETLGA